MIYKTYNCNSFNVYTIKTDKFKTCHMEIIFRKPITKENALITSFLCDIMSEASKKYKTHKDLVIRLEELYKAVFYGITTKTGKTLNTNFVLDFINPSFIEEDNYLENVLKLPFEIIQNPLVINGEFDLKTFNIIKERTKKDLISIQENPVKIVFRDLFKNLDEDSETAISLLGSEEEIEKITPSKLYEVYQKLFKENICDIYIIGNLDMDEVVSLIKKYFKNRIINKKEPKLYVENKLRKKENIISKEGNFIQANIGMVLNLDKLSKLERDIVVHVYNYILGSGGLTSKLYQSLREQNSLCYSISCLYLKYDGLLAIHVSLDNSNIKKALTLIKKEIKNMAKGEFTLENLEDAKKNLALSLDYNLDNSIALINNYVFENIDNLPKIEERKESFAKVTKEDVLNVAKKVKYNTVYILKGGK